jgi:hypothetical protein
MGTQRALILFKPLGLIAKIQDDPERTIKQETTGNRAGFSNKCWEVIGR